MGGASAWSNNGAESLGDPREHRRTVFHGRNPDVGRMRPVPPEDGGTLLPPYYRLPWFDVGETTPYGVNRIVPGGEAPPGLFRPAPGAAHPGRILLLPHPEWPWTSRRGGA